MTIRRLNRVEYNNTIRDLVGIDFQPADDFPSDDVGYGFDNIGDVLSMPPILLEKYLAAAEKLAALRDCRSVATDGRGANVYRRPANFRAVRPQGNRWAAWKPRVTCTSIENFWPRGITRSASAPYGEHAGDEPPRMALRLDGKDLARFAVTAVAERPAVYETRTHVATGKRRIAAAYLNNFVDPENPDPARRDRNLILQSVEIDGPYGEVLPRRRTGN